MKKYLYRNKTKNVKELLEFFPVVAILGPRQVGKTTLAKRIAETLSRDFVYLDLESRVDILKLDDPYFYLDKNKDKIIILDEIQRKPELFMDLRSIIDSYNVPGRFIVLGSASQELLKQSSETLAGRIAYLELTPFTLDEIPDADKLWFRGGFPLSYLSSNGNSSKLWISNFIKTFLQRDIPSLGIKIPPLQIEQFWEMLAHLNGHIWNASLIGKNFGLSSPTIKNYLSLLESTYMVRQLYPFASNVKKRLVKTPKIYIRDTGILHTLLRIDSMDRLLGNPIIGMSYEGWVIEQICNTMNENIRPYFYRTHSGAEIDLILDTPNGLIAVEIKRSLMPKPSRGFYEAVNDLNITEKYIIYPGNDVFKIKDNILVLPLEQFILKLDSLR